MVQPVTPVSDRIALGAVLAVVAARCMIAFAPLPVFDMDPVQESAPFVGAGPAQSVLLDAVLLFGAGWLLVRCAQHARSLPSWWAWAAAACVAPAAVALAHALQDAEFLWRAATWISAPVAALAVVGASRTDRRDVVRRAVGAALAGIGVAVAVRGLVQMTIEHAATVAFYEQQKELFIRAQGWLPGSTEVLTYERRLLQNEATGWFGFANVFATVAAATALLLAGAASGGGRSAARAVLWTGALLCAGLVAVSGSKGGAASLALGVVLWVALWRRPGWARALAFIPVAALLALVVRGAIGPSWGELSLLFRWQYLVGAARMLGDAPLLGVGPGGFQGAFMQLRPLAAVEEPASAHGAFADWAAALGIAGLLLGGAMLCMLWNARASAPQRAAHGACEPATGRIVREVALTSVVFGAILSALFEAPSLDGAAWLWRACGAAAGVAVAWAVALQSGDAAQRCRSGVACGLVVAALVVAVHGQIDMAFWLPGSVAWGWMVLASAPGAAGDPPEESALDARAARGRALLGWSWAGLSCAAAAVLALVISPALALQEEEAIAAARGIADGARRGGGDKLAAARSEGAQRLAAASVRAPRRRALALCAAEQWLAAARCSGDRNAAATMRAAADESAALAADAPWSRFGALRIASFVAEDRLRLAPTRHAAAAWEESLRAVLAVNPRHCESMLSLAAALAAQGRIGEAREAVDQAALCSESFAADPLRQIPPARMDAARAAVEAAAANPARSGGTDPQR